MFKRMVLCVIIFVGLIVLSGNGYVFAQAIEDHTSIEHVDFYLMDREVAHIVLLDRDDSMCATSGELRFYKKKGKGKKEIQTIGETPLSIESVSGAEWEPILTKTFGPRDFSWFQVMPDKKHYGLTAKLPNLQRGDVIKVEFYSFEAYATVF